MKTVFHKSGGRQMYQSAARSFRKESTASCRFLQEFIWAQAARAALRRLPRHSAARHFLPAEVDRLLGQHELEHQVVAGRGNAVLTAEAADSAGDDTDLGLAVMRDVLHHGADGLISHARDLIGVLQLGVMVERAAAGVRHDDGLFYQHAGRLVGVLVAVDKAVLGLEQGAHAVDGDVRQQLVPDGVHHVLVDLDLKTGGAQALGHFLDLGHGGLQRAKVRHTGTGVLNVAGADGRGAERRVADDDLLFGHDLGDLIVVAKAVLQAEDHGVLVDHRQRIAHSRFKILIVDEHDQKIHNADLLGVGRRHGGMEDDGLAGARAGHALVDENAVFLDGLDDRSIGIQHADLMLAGQIACIAAADRAAADKSDFHGK